MNYEALRSEALLHAGKARKMAAKLFNDPQASQVDAGDLLISMAQLVELCVAATPAPARCANGPMGCDYPRCDCNGASTKESNQ